MKYISLKLVSLDLEGIVELSTADQHLLDFSSVYTIVTNHRHEVGPLSCVTQRSVGLHINKGTGLNLSSFLELKAIIGLR